MAETNIMKQRLTIRIGRGTLSFAQPVLAGSGTAQEAAASSQQVLFEPYVVKSGVSMAANLREAFKSSDLLLNPPPRVRVFIDTDVLMVPVECFDEKQMETMYLHAFPRINVRDESLQAGAPSGMRKEDAVYYNVLPDLNAVAVFAMNKDLRLVIDDHFSDVKLISVNTPVWRYLHQRSFTGTRYKLCGYFHEQRLEVFCFQQNRFRFCNSFSVRQPHDALYFLLYVWNQLQLQPRFDELHIVGDIPEQEWLLAQLRRFLQKAYVINPSADFNRAQVTAIKGMPYDLQTLFVKGR